MCSAYLLVMAFGFVGGEWEDEKGCATKGASDQVGFVGAFGWKFDILIGSERLSGQIRTDKFEIRSCRPLKLAASLNITRHLDN